MRHESHYALIWVSQKKKLTSFPVISPSDCLGCQFTLFAHGTSEMDNGIATQCQHESMTQRGRIATYSGNTLITLPPSLL